MVDDADIVTRLRRQRTNAVICNEAADEIERLRENNGYLNKTVDLFLAARKGDRR